MDAQLINPFVSATVVVLKTMAQTEPVVGKPGMKKDQLSWGEVTGLIGMAGDGVTGNMIISFDEPSILGIVSKMLMEEFVEINQDVIDAVGEITNMIVGGAKNSLQELGYNIHMATPIVIKGKNVELNQLGKAPALTIPFTTDVGSFVLEANLAKT